MIFRNPQLNTNIPFGTIIYDLQTHVTIQPPETITASYYTDNGYFEVLAVVPPEFDARKEKLSALIEVIDAVNKTITGHYDVLELPLPDVKLLAKQRATAEYAFETNNGFVCSNGIKTWADVTDIQMLKSAQELAVLTSTAVMRIKDFDGGYHEVNTPDVLTMCIEAGVFNSTHWNTLQDKIIAIDAATTVDEVLAIA